MSDAAPTPFDDGELYDALLGRLDYGLDFYLALGRAAGGPVLDLCCGTGRVLLPLLADGVDVDGVDLYPSMLDRLRANAARRGLTPTLHRADMRAFHTGRKYALVLIPFNAVVHALTTDDQIATLTRCREHLLPGGVLALDTFFPGPLVTGGTGGARDFEIEVTDPDTGRTLRCYDTRTVDRVEQLMHSANEIEVLDAAGGVAEVRRSWTTIRWVYKGEMELLLRAAGFARWEVAGDFAGKPLAAETDIMVVTAWAAGPEWAAAI